MQVISQPGRLDITDEVEAVRSEAKKLKKQGVDIIIAVGHAGHTKDQKIAKLVDEVDVVVGGHSNTFLYNGMLEFRYLHSQNRCVVLLELYKKMLVKMTLIFDNYSTELCAYYVSMWVQQFDSYSSSMIHTSL